MAHSRLVDRVTPFRAVPDSLDSRRTGHHSGEALRRLAGSLILTYERLSNTLRRHCDRCAHRFDITKRIPNLAVSFLVSLFCDLLYTI